MVKNWLPLRTKYRWNPSLLACQSALHWCNRIKISTYQTKSKLKTSNNCNAMSSGWWEKADTVITLKGIILKINFLTELCLNAMRKGGWEKKSYLNSWEKSWTEDQVLFWRKRGILGFDPLKGHLTKCKLLPFSLNTDLIITPRVLTSQSQVLQVPTRPEIDSDHPMHHFGQWFETAWNDISPRIHQQGVLGVLYVKWFEWI